MHAALERAFGLEDRVAVVTGAGAGIGREIALVLAEAGATVVIADVAEAPLAATLSLVRQAGGTAIARPTDVASRAAVDTLAQAALDACGRIDVWVNCAGIIHDAAVIETDEADLDRVIAVNLKGVYFGCAAAGRAMRARGAGAIVNISSGGGESPVPRISTYSLTKAAVNMLTRTCAKEFGAFGVRVNAVAPGWVDTVMGGRRFLNADGSIDLVRQAEVMRGVTASSPLGITGEPRDIALAVLYLASDAARFVTGQILRPNGGVAMP